MWQLHSLASEYSKLPSEIMGLPAHSWEAWSLDVTCLQVGRWIEGKLDQRDNKGKPKYTLAQLLREKELPQENEFMSLKGFARRAVVPASGVW